MFAQGRLLGRVLAGGRRVGDVLGGVAPRSWSLWTNRAALLGYVLVVDVLAVATMAWAFCGGFSFGAHELVVLVALTAGVVVHVEVTARVERLRELAADGGDYVDIKSMWGFAAILMLPLGLALAVVVLTWAWFWLRVSRRPVPHRWFFSAATSVLASAAAAAVVDAAGASSIVTGLDLRDLLLLAAAALLRSAINFGLVVGALSLAAPTRSWRARLGRPMDHAVDLGALALGIALAALAATAPLLVVFLVVPVLTLHRGMGLEQLASAVCTDGKTGALTSAHWHNEATRLLGHARRCARPLSILMIDLDHFKEHNDTHGHLAGDEVLAAVVTAIRKIIRPEDLLARFGGEEFVVLLPDTTAATAAVLGEGVRATVAGLAVRSAASLCGAREIDGITVSVGVATSSADSAASAAGHRRATLDGLLLAADGALYTAKRDGRDRVRLADAPDAVTRDGGASRRS